MRITNLLLIATNLVIGTGCSVLPTKTTETQRQTIYAVRDDINAGRFDLADRDSNQLTKLFPPPKKRIPVKPIDK